MGRRKDSMSDILKLKIWEDYCRNPSIKLQTLADHYGHDQSTVSNIITEYLKKRFYKAKEIRNYELYNLQTEQ